MVATMTVKGQIVIPAETRKRMGLKKGTRFQVLEKDGKVILQPLTREYFMSLSGILKGAGLLEGLRKSRAEDLAKEEAKLGRRKGRR